MAERETVLVQRLHKFENIMKTNLQSNLTSGLSFKNEVKSVLSIQQGQKYGFILEIESPFGKYYCPVQAFTTKEQALRVLRSQLK